jgi:hypothetical protein
MHPESHSVQRESESLQPELHVCVLSFTTSAYTCIIELHSVQHESESVQLGYPLFT